MAPLTRFLTKIESSKKSKACLEMPKRRKKLSKKRVVVRVYSACSEFQHLKPQMHQGCLVILWNTSLNLSFHWNWFGWGTEVFHQSSKVPHLWVLAQIFTISVVFLIEKSVCKGADLRLWIPVAGVFFVKKRTKGDWELYMICLAFFWKPQVSQPWGKNRPRRRWAWRQLGDGTSPSCWWRRVPLVRRSFRNGRSMGEIFWSMLYNIYIYIHGSHVYYLRLAVEFDLCLRVFQLGVAV